MLSHMRTSCELGANNNDRARRAGRPPRMSDVEDSIKRMREERWRQLMEAAQKGDKGAYEDLLSDLLPVLRSYVRRKWRNAADVEDVVQDILLSIHGVRQTYDPRRPFMPWLMTIAKRRLIDAARKVSARSKHETTVEVMPETFQEHDAKTEYDTYDDQEAIRSAFGIESREASQIASCSSGLIPAVDALALWANSPSAHASGTSA